MYACIVMYNIIYIYIYIYIYIWLMGGRHRIRNVNYKPRGFVLADFVRVREKEE
jgi:hypothetical protein